MIFAGGKQIINIAEKQRYEIPIIPRNGISLTFAVLMNAMIVIENTLVSEDLIISRFCCKLQECRGACCVEGDAGAPLEAEEPKIIAKYIRAIRPYMEEAGLNTLKKEGISTKDILGALVTTLNPGKECLFTYFKNGIAYCAVEKAWTEGKIPFQKPISCHLYPVRISKFDLYDAVNVHQWHVCATGWKEGDGIPLYQYLKAPLIRKFGELWYEQLEAAAQYVNDKSGK